MRQSTAQRELERLREENRQLFERNQRLKFRLAEWHDLARQLAEENGRLHKALESKKGG